MRKARSFIILMAIVLTSGLIGSSGAAQQGETATLEAILGTWDLVTQTPQSPLQIQVTFELQGGELTATDALAGPAKEVAFADGSASFVIEAERQTYRVAGRVDGDRLAGEVVVSGGVPGREGKTYELTGTRRPRLSGDLAAIAEVANRWAEANAAKDIDAMMELISDDYRSDILPDKAGMRAFWKLAIENGMSEDMKLLRIDPGEIEVEGDTAKTGRIFFQVKDGRRSQKLELKKEDGVWRITKGFS